MTVESGLYIVYSVAILAGVDVQLCEQPTNEVTYFHYLADVTDMPSHLKPFLPLFCTVANK